MGILIIEDQEEIRNIVKAYLEGAGYHVYEAADGLSGLTVFRQHEIELVILDIMMPGLDGFGVMENIRSYSNAPVIFLTAKEQEHDRLKGFTLGADDYVTKPFSPRELVMRVKALLSRVKGTVIDDRLLVGDLSLDLGRHTLKKGSASIPITTAEFEILKVFFAHEGQLLSRSQLIEKAFGYDYEGTDRNIDSIVKRLRTKIEDNPKEPRYLITKYGAGYQFGDPYDH